jgi:glyoxylase-like metal-dependent hydrolase (beta-lactamase superfamily II)
VNSTLGCAVPRPGVHPVRMPIAGSMFGGSNAYLVETGRALVLVDAGEASAVSRQALAGGVRAAGHDLSEITAVLLTHAHFDHAGSAEWVREAGGARVIAHPAEIATLLRHATQSEAERHINALAITCGATSGDLPAPTPGASGPLRLEQADDPAREDVDLAGLAAVPTAGHSPGHVSYWWPERSVLFCGDAMFASGSSTFVLTELPDGDASGLGDPVGEHLRSLRRMADLNADIAFPGHLGPIQDVTARTRVLADRTEQRLQAVADAVAMGPATPWSIAQRLRWGRTWPEFSLRERRTALLSTLAFLRALYVTGNLVRASEAPVRYERPAAVA